MLATSTMFSAAVALDDNRSAKSLQIDLVDQACQTLQNLHNIKESDSATQFFFDDHRFLERFVKYDGDLGSDRFHCMLNSRLNFAAFYGCHHYVRSCLSTETYSADQMSALLQLTIAGLEQLVIWLGRLVVYSVCLPRLVTLQVILQRGLDLDLNEYAGDIAVESSSVYSTPFGRLFHILVLASRNCQERDKSTVQRRHTDTQQRFKECCVELTQKLVSIGANPNTRLITEIRLEPGNTMLGGLLMSYSLLSLLEISGVENEALKACFCSAGAIHYKGIPFVLYKSYYYRTDAAQSQRLYQLLVDFEKPDNFLEILHQERALRISVSVVESLREVLESIAKNYSMSKRDLLRGIERSKGSI